MSLKRAAKPAAAAAAAPASSTSGSDGLDAAKALEKMRAFGDGGADDGSETESEPCESVVRAAECADWC